VIRIRWPWQRRAEHAEQAAERAAEQLDEVRGRWPLIHRLAEESKRHDDLNGWTAIIKATFEGHDPGRKSS